MSPFKFHDPYIDWAQRQRPETFDLDLGSSGLRLEWSWAAWDVELGALPPDGPNWHGDVALRRRLGAELGVGEEQVLLAPGCTGANALVIAALVRPGDRVAVERPAYSPLVSLLRGFDAWTVRLDREPERRWGFDPDLLFGNLQGCVLCLITNPHNPTGRLLARRELKDLAGACRRDGTLLVVDEVYREFPSATPVPSAISVGENVVVTSSVTKAYGLGGLRVGWVAGPPAVMERIREANKVLLGRGSVPGEWLVEKLLARESAWRELRQTIAARIEAGRAVAARFVASRPDLSWVVPDAGITGLVRLPPGWSGEAFARRAREDARVYIVPGEFFDAPGTVRLSFGAGPDTVEKGLQRLAAILDAGA